jgi:hypothetical protein
MTSMRRSLPALDRVVQMYKNKLYNLHKPKMIELNKQLAELNDKRAKEIVADIEKYAADKFPELRIPLKCERAHSTIGSDSIQVGLYFEGVDSPEAKMIKVKLLAAKEQEDENNRILERWKMSCMLSMAAGEGFPPLGIAGIEDLNSDQNYYPGG